jgi:hypothetical protein
LGWFGEFVTKYNSFLDNNVNFNDGIVQPVPNVGAKFKTIGRQSKLQSITKGAITVDILGPHISPASNLDVFPMKLYGVELSTLMEKVQEASLTDWRLETLSPGPKLSHADVRQYAGSGGPQ